MASQTFISSTEAILGAITIFTRDFRTNSSAAEANTCYLALYDDATGKRLANSDNTYHGYACAGDLSFTFKNSQPPLAEGARYRWEYVFGTQNFSRISFLGTPTDAVEGAFSSDTIADAKFSVYAELEPPSLLTHYAPDGTALPGSGTVPDSTVILTATLRSPGSDSLRLEIEIQPSFMPFTGIPNIASALTEIAPHASSSSMRIETSALPNGAYHWQARAADPDGNTPVWSSPEYASATVAFFIEEPSSGIVLEDAATAYQKDTQPTPCFDDGTFLSCAFAPTSTAYKVPGPFTLSRVTFTWRNSGANNCDNLGTYRAAIAGEDPAVIIASSTDSVYLGCAGTGGTAKLHFTSTTVPADFHFTLDSDDGLQGGSHVTVSDVRLYGTFAQDPSLHDDPEEEPPTASSTPPAARRPVVIIPGILGSRLAMEQNDEELWPNADLMIASLSDTYLDPLALDTSGRERPGNEMYVTDILRAVTTSAPFIKEDVYQPLIDALAARGWREGADLFTAPYDWRMGIAQAAQEIIPVMRKAAAASPDGTVDVVAHSMGGLVAKEYLSAATGTAPVGRLILVGVPQLGAPEMFSTLNYGDDLGFRVGPLALLYPREVKSIAQNMPSAYELLPSPRYVATQGGYVIANRASAHAPLDFTESTQAMLRDPSDARNAGLLAAAAEFHEQRDRTVAHASEIYVIAGCQNPATPTGFLLQDDGEVEVLHGTGDGTVPLASALNMANEYHTYFSLYAENGADHMGLVRAQGPTTLIGALLEDGTSSLALGPLGMSTSTKDCMEGRSTFHRESTVMIYATGPVSLDAYDGHGRRIGPATTGISTSMIALPLSETYHVTLSATATGTFTMKADVYDDTATLIRRATYLNVPLTSGSSTAVFTLDTSTTAPSFTITNDAQTTIVAPTAVLSGAIASDITPPVVTIAPIPNAIANNEEFTLSFSAEDDGSGIASVTAALDENTVENDAVIRNLAPGTHQITVTAFDRAGNPRLLDASFTVYEHASSTNDSSRGEDNRGGNGTSTGGNIVVGGEGGSAIVYVPALLSQPATTGTPPPRRCRPRPNTIP